MVVHCFVHRHTVILFHEWECGPVLQLGMIIIIYSTLFVAHDHQSQSPIFSADGHCALDICGLHARSYPMMHRQDF
jgi:hypothetical protein